MNHLFIVGAQRSGTTYLYHMLQHHPQIAMAQPVRPEPKFFLSEELCKRGRAFYEEQYFRSHSSETRFFGEKGTSYIESISAAERIHTYYPNAYIILIIRDPVTRAYSNYLFSLQNGLEHLEFNDALAVETGRLRDAKYKTSVNPFAYRKRGYYMDYVKPYLKIFNSEQIKILIFEEFVGNQTAVQSLYSWLGVENDFDPGCIDVIYNPADSAKPQDEGLMNVFRDLSIGYQESLEELEWHMGKKIQTWRAHWEDLRV